MSALRRVDCAAQTRRFGMKRSYHLPRFRVTHTSLNRSGVERGTFYLSMLTPGGMRTRVSGQRRLYRFRHGVYHRCVWHLRATLPQQLLLGWGKCGSKAPIPQQYSLARRLRVQLEESQPSVILEYPHRGGAIAFVLLCPQILIRLALSKR